MMAFCVIFLPTKKAPLELVPLLEVSVVVGIQH